MKRIFLTIVGVLALAANLKATSADEAAMAALYPEHETFFEHELHPIQRAVEPAQRISVTSIDLLFVHISELGQ